MIEEEGNMYCKERDIKCSDLDQDSSSCLNADLQDGTKNVVIILLVPLVTNASKYQLKKDALMIMKIYYVKETIHLVERFAIWIILKIQ